MPFYVYNPSMSLKQTLSYSYILYTSVYKPFTPLTISIYVTQIVAYNSI